MFCLQNSEQSACDFKLVSVSGKISFLTIPPHSQLIPNHDAEVYAP